jgi:NADH-quinone oxidoreductase subunit J
MSASAIMFYLISAFILTTGILAVTTSKIFRSAIWLLFSLVGVAALYFWMQLEFIAAVQIVVYVGGIVVLIIFSIFLTQQSGKDLPKPVLGKAVFSALATILGCAFSFMLIRNYGFNESAVAPFNFSVSDIGTQLLSTTDHGYVLPFEVVSMLLLAAMIGCIVIAMKQKTEETLSASDDSIPLDKVTQLTRQELVNISSPLKIEEEAK